MKTLKPWILPAALVLILGTLFLINRTWSLCTAFFILGMIFMLAIGYVIDVKMKR